MNFIKCTSTCSHRDIPVRECSRVFRILNPNGIQVATIRVDGCLIKDQITERCDYLFEFCTSTETAIYVELKGADIQKAVNQLIKTMGYLKNRHKSHRKICYVVASRVPKSGPKVQNLRLEMAKKRVLLFVATNSASVSLAHSPYS